ncbi:MAG: hypothetical protein QNK37_01140 [Acidobacteriota bacterium]|nr:hypothetical protein [Acidobacteriota bacterium]
MVAINHKAAHGILWLIIVFLVYAKFRPVENAFEKGIELERAGDHEAAYQLWERSASKGDLNGFVGLAHANFRKDPVEAVRLARYAMYNGKGLTRGRAAWIL